MLDQAIDFDTTSRIHLYLRQGDPVDILNGLGQKLANCDRILFRYPWLPKSIQSQVEAILLRNGFVQSKNDDSSEPSVARLALVRGGVKARSVANGLPR